ncbi:hypothetical protein C2S52_020200 [Perilla frutescens var. hirtella]|nr:hypothetical protein C2S52_020200 [Perilla frutescens var. hirtella]
MGMRDEIRLLKLLGTEIQMGGMADVFHAVPTMLRIAAIMTAVVGKNITGLDVACKLEQMRRSFEDFMWFKSLPGVHYDTNINRVTVLPEYWDKYDLPTDESPNFLIFRLKREPRYRLFYEVYTQGGWPSRRAVDHFQAGWRTSKMVAEADIRLLVVATIDQDMEPCFSALSV